MIAVVRALLKRRDALKAGWDLNVFGRDPAPATGFDKAVRNQFFWVYAELLEKLAGGLDALGTWAEGCRCHEADFGGMAERRQYNTRRRLVANQLRQAAAGPAVDGQPVPGESDLRLQRLNCKLKGRRACEFAQGVFTRYINDVHRTLFADLQAVVERSGLGPQPRATGDDSSVG